MSTSESTTGALGAVRQVEPDGRGIRLQCDGGTLRVEAWGEGVARITITRAGQEAEPSWAVLPERGPEEAPEVIEETGGYTLAMPGVVIRVHKSDGGFRVETASGRVVMDGVAPNFPNEGARLEWTQPDDRRVYACGENAGPLDRRTAPMEFWNTDHYAYAVGAGPLYQSIPFALFMDEGCAAGLFVDNTWRQRWDLTGDRAVVETDGGALDLYVFTNAGAKEVLSAFTGLVGRAPLPPLWSLGFHQSRYSYYPESQVRDLARAFRERRIPCDAIYFDIHYMDRYKDFTWDLARFPDPPALLADLKADGFQSVVILDPGVKVEDGYSVYEELKAAGFYVKQADGAPYIGKVWPGDCLFPDYTGEDCRAWWGGQYETLLAQGVSGFWNDMNEPAIFESEGRTMPMDTFFDGDHGPGDQARFHNIYGMQMARASYEGLRRLCPNERAFLLSRAGYAGASRYGATWTGDNVASWEHLRVSLPMVLNFGLSGQAISGPDIGGFVGDPSPELFLRWMQAAALMPYCRVHSAKPDHDNPDAVEEGFTPREPWVFGPEWEPHLRAAIELRYRLLPTLYTLAEEAARTGVPILRPLFLEFPDDPRAVGRDDQYMVGPHLLAAPVMEDGARTRAVYLPDGLWYDFWSGEALAGGREVTADAPLERLPLYVRAGSVLALQPVVQHTGEMPGQPLEMRAYLQDGRAEGEVYEDDGRSMDFERGAFRRAHYSVRNNNVYATVEGDYRSPRPEAHWEFIGAAR